MWCEFLYVILAYFEALRKNETIYDILIPAIIAFASFIYTILSHYDTIQIDFINEVMPFVGTLLGFTLAALTLLLSNTRIEGKMRNFPNKRAAYSSFKG